MAFCTFTISKGVTSLSPHLVWRMLLVPWEQDGSHCLATGSASQRSNSPLCVCISYQFLLFLVAVKALCKWTLNNGLLMPMLPMRLFFLLCIDWKLDFPMRSRPSTELLGWHGGRMAICGMQIWVTHLLKEQNNLDSCHKLVTGGWGVFWVTNPAHSL